MRPSPEERAGATRHSLPTTAGGKRRDFYGTLPPCRVRSVEGARVFVQDAFSRTIMLLAFQNSRGFTDSVRRVREARAALLQAAPLFFNNPRAASGVHARSLFCFGNSTPRREQSSSTSNIASAPPRLFPARDLPHLSVSSPTSLPNSASEAGSGIPPRYDKARPH